MFFDRRQLHHDPQFYLVRGRVTQCAERPERAEFLLASAEGAGHRLVVPGDFGPSPRAAIHTPEYLDFLATAYEHWHRMLFARFLAENDLLIHPEMQVGVTLEECAELAPSEGAADAWELAGRYASRMLPQIFRPDCRWRTIRQYDPNLGWVTRRVMVCE